MMTGLYLYCVARGEAGELPNLFGLHGTPVRVLSHHGLLAVVQDCDPAPQATEDQTRLAEWILIHQNIVDWAWGRYETVIPFGFNTIIVATDGKTAEENLNDWLGKEGAELTRKLEFLSNKAEYGVQVLWDPGAILPQIRATDKEIAHMEEEIRAKSEGVAYLLRKKLEEIIRKRLEETADSYFKIFYKQIRDCVENICVEKIRKEAPPKQMIMNISCLQDRQETQALGAVLEKIGRMKGVDVRFTGPWPPYSFVNC